MNPASESLTRVPAEETQPPARSGKTKRSRIFLTPAAVAVLVVPVLGLTLVGRWSRVKPATHTVRHEKLHRAITLRGDLEAVDTSNIVCQVRSRTHGRTSST